MFVSIIRVYHPYGILFVLRRVFPTKDVFARKNRQYEDFTVKQTVQYGRVFRMDDSSVQRRLPFARLRHVEELSTRRCLPYISFLKRPCVWKGFPCWSFFGMEDSSIRGTCIPILSVSTGPSEKRDTWMSFRKERARGCRLITLFVSDYKSVAD